MEVLITGAAGFIGRALAVELLRDYELKSLTLVDIVEPPHPSPESKTSCLLRGHSADLTKAETVESLFTPNLTHVFLLHGIMSGAAEADLDAGLAANIDSTRLILDCLRRTCPGIRIIYTSTCAIYGPPEHDPDTKKPILIQETCTLPKPGSSYGASKLISETLLSDYSRRGLLDGVVVRLPTVVVRPGKPTGAASSFCSGLFREPLAGEECRLPVPKHLPIWITGARTVVRNIARAAKVDGDVLDRGRSRAVNLPGIVVSVQDMLDTLEKVGGRKASCLVKEEEDQTTRKIVEDWNPWFDDGYATRLGFDRDEKLETIVEEYIRDYGAQAQAKD